MSLRVHSSNQGDKVFGPGSPHTSIQDSAVWSQVGGSHEVPPLPFHLVVGLGQIQFTFHAATLYFHLLKSGIQHPCMFQISSPLTSNCPFLSQGLTKRHTVCLIDLLLCRTCWANQSHSVKLCKSMTPHDHLTVNCKKVCNAFIVYLKYAIKYCFSSYSLTVWLDKMVLV